MSSTGPTSASDTRGRKRFAFFCWSVLAYNIPVIIWGAFVRASFSGDGCGAHWPFCNGQVIPQSMAKPMAIEFAHRMMTSIDTFAVVGIVVWAFVLFPKRNMIRRAAVWSLVFLLIEAILGAGLVLFRYVAKDQSAGRAFYLSAHLTNTMLLLASLTLTAWLASRSNLTASGIAKSISGRMRTALGVTVLVSITGAIAALGDMLFPAASIVAGMQQDFASESSMLLRLRLIHPIFAVAGAVYLVWVAATLLRSHPEGRIHTAASRVLFLTLFQIAAGALNWTLLAPIWMQLFHLLVADGLWIAVVLLALETGTGQPEPVSAPASTYVHNVG